MPIRKLILALVLVAVCLPAGRAAAAVTLPVVQGRVLYENEYIGGVTWSGQVVVVGMKRGTIVTFRRICSVCATPDATFTQYTPANGALGLIQDSYIDFRPGEGWTITLTDPQGRARTVAFRADTDDTPILTEDCAQRDAAGAMTPIGCEVRCSTSRRYPAGDPCRDAGGTVSIPDGKVVRSFAGDSKTTKVKRLTVSSVPKGAVVVVICRGPDPQGDDCPFSVRTLGPKSGKVDVGDLFRDKSLKPGVQILIWLVRGGERGDVVRFTMRKGRRPRVEKLCMPPTSLTPAHC